jgi:AcrR family transcriptional regulator
MTLDRHRISRERILEGANTILDSGDYADLTVDALARSLRMSKSTLYKYFSSKEDVIIALVRDACDQAESELDVVLGRGPAPAQLVELAAIIGRHGQRLPRAVLVDLQRLPRTCIDRIRQTRRAFASSALKVLERGVSLHELNHPEPALAATAFAAACEAVLVEGAGGGLPEYGVRVTQVPELFLPALAPLYNR